MSRTKGGRRWKTAIELLNAWEEYKNWCDHQTVTQTVFSQKDSRFVTQAVPHPVTYTVKGFCVYHKMTEANFYITYVNDEHHGISEKAREEFKLVIACMKEECENDARQKFENGTIDPKLAGLWMSKHGYTTNVDQKVDADMTLNVKVDYGEE